MSDIRQNRNGKSIFSTRTIQLPSYRSWTGSSLSASLPSPISKSGVVVNIRVGIYMDVLGSKETYMESIREVQKGKRNFLQSITKFWGACHRRLGADLEVAWSPQNW